MHRPKILLVEDEPDLRRLYAIGLNQRGYEVKLASNGAEAVERIKSERPDLVLLDWVMPLMNGGDVLDRLTADGASHVTVIVISGQPEPPQLDGRIEAWLSKPVTLDSLVEAIDRCGPPARSGGVR